MAEPISSDVPQDAAGPGVMDVAEIFYAPSAVFERRRSGAFGLPLLILVIAGAVLAFASMGLIGPALKADTLRGMQKAVAAHQITADQAAQQTGTVAKFAPVGIAGFDLVAPFVAGLVIWLVGFVTRARVRFGVAVMIATFSLYPRLLGAVAASVLALVLPDAAQTSMMHLSLSPAFFIDPAVHPGLGALLARFEIFTLWSYLLVTIGVRILSGATRGQAAMTAVLTWLILSLPSAWTFVTQG